MIHSDQCGAVRFGQNDARTVRDDYNARRKINRMALARSIRVLTSLLLIASFGVIATAQRRQQGEGRWERLGTSRVDGRRDHDSIRVNTRGSFRAIQLRVQGGDVEFQRVVVRFENGDDTEVEIRDRIRTGGATRNIDLPGDQRRIRSVEFWYGRENWGRHRPTLTLYGRR